MSQNLHKHDVYYLWRIWYGCSDHNMRDKPMSNASGWSSDDYFNDGQIFWDDSIWGPMPGDYLAYAGLPGNPGNFPADNGNGIVSPDPYRPTPPTLDPTNPFGFGNGQQMIDPTQQPPEFPAPVPPADIFPGWG